MHSKRFFRLRGIPFIVVVCLTAALAVYVGYEIVTMRHLVSQLQKNDRDRNEVRNVLIGLLDTETGQRGFLLTGQETYLESYYRGKRQVNRSLNTIDVLSENDASLNAWISSLNVAAHRKLEDLERTIILKKHGDDGAAIAIVRGGFGKLQMDEARHLIRLKLDEFAENRAEFQQQISGRLLQASVALGVILISIVSLILYSWRSLTVLAEENSRLSRRLNIEGSFERTTGLPNKNFLVAWVNKIIAKNRRANAPFILMMLGLNGVENVSSVSARSEHHEILNDVASRFQTVLRPGELLAKLDGEVFAVVLEETISSDAVHRLGRRLIDSLTAPLSSQFSSGAISVSIGVAVYPENGLTFDDLYNAAFGALRWAKESRYPIVSFAPESVQNS